MKRFSFHKDNVGLLAALVFLAAFLARMNVCCSLAAEPSGRSGPQWPHLSEVKKKWGAVDFEQVRQAAEKGELTAAHYLGFCYAEGERVPTNAKLALTWYERAANAGYIPSFNNLGVLYQRGRIVPRDYTRALNYFRRAADAGMPGAQVNLGFMYRDGQGVQCDPVAALKWFRMGADQGDTAGMLSVGRAYRFGHGVPRDPDMAVHWFELSDNGGDLLGTLNLAIMYSYDENTLRDWRKAVSLFLKAAQNGQPDSMYELFLAYKRGFGVPVDRQVANGWLIRAAESGHAVAQAALGDSLENPFPEEGTNFVSFKNLPAAVDWYRRSANQGCSRGQYHLGLCYLKGTGVELNEETGLDLIRKAADDGYYVAIEHLSWLYSRGIGEPRSEQERPIELLKRLTLAKSNEPYGVVKQAYDGLIYRYQYGVGTERDLVAAAEAYCEAAAKGILHYTLHNKLNYMAPESKPQNRAMYSGTAERSRILLQAPDLDDLSDELRFVLATYLSAAKGNPSSLAEIGDRYHTGRGVPVSLEKAWAWLSLASGKGTTNVNPGIRAVQDRLSPAEKDNARRFLSMLPGSLAEVSDTVPPGEL